jgi:transcriptional regulator with XRE-family HTH domain
MRLPEIGHVIRRARGARNLTQAALASAVGLSRATLNQLENGVVRDLGIRKVLALTNTLGLELVVRPLKQQQAPDFVQIASTTASVSFKEPLTPEDLVSILLKGKVPALRRPQMRALFEEASPVLLRGLAQEVGRWSKPGRIEKNLIRIAHELGVSRKVHQWLI